MIHALNIDLSQSPDGAGADAKVIPLPTTRMVPRIYRGIRKVSGCIVTVSIGGRERPLNPRLDLANHSPTGFDWGYGGSGPSQLALAILADALADDERAIALYQRFKSTWVCSLTRDEPWAISDVDVRQIVEAIEHAAEARAGGC